MDRQSSTPTPYAVICPTHGQVFLTETEYSQQLSRPNSLWKCPCGEIGSWDDDNWEKYLDSQDDQQSP